MKTEQPVARRVYQMADSGSISILDELSSHGRENLDGARLIAPSITKYEPLELFSKGENKPLDGFQMALDGAYPLRKPVLDLVNRTIYSVDMVRVEFFYDIQQDICDLIDTQVVFATMETYTSNRIGTYRFMWIFRFADGSHGGYRIEKDGEVIEDGNEDVVLKCGYGVVGKGGQNNKKGFVEFNPNKCESNARRFLEMLYAKGCIFSLKRYDIAIDKPIDRNAIRLIRDRRKYEFVLSSKGGVTEYLGQRSTSGRVKVYDKAGEQGMDADLSRIELTAASHWELNEIREHLPVCVDFSSYKGKGLMLAFCNLLSELMHEKDENGKPTERSNQMVPERYLQILPKNTRYRLKKALANSSKIIEYNDAALTMCGERARSFILE